MELTNRKKRILRAVVEIYIATAEPVGSKAVAEQAGLDISSATIRNEMADLTEMGYLEQQHGVLLFQYEVSWHDCIYLPKADCPKSGPTPRPAGFPPLWATGCTSTSSWASTG